MGGNRVGEPLQVVAPFQDRHNPPGGATFGNLHQPLRHPGVIAFHEIQVCEGIAHVGVEGWELRIEGAVERPLRLTYAEILRRPAETVQSVLECFGNPVEPEVATRRVGNVSWRGAPLWPLLEEAGPEPRAPSLWLEAPDHGSFAGTPSESRTC